MKKTFLLLLIFLLAGCSDLPNSASQSPTSIPTSAPSRFPARIYTNTPAAAGPSATVFSPTQALSTPAAAYPLVSPLLLPAYGARPRDISAKIEWKGQPSQPYLQLQGMLANSCQDWAIYVNPPDEHELIVVSVAVDSNESTGACSENAVPVQHEVLLGPFNSGQYTVYVNDSRVGDLTIP